MTYVDKRYYALSNKKVFPDPVGEDIKTAGILSMNHPVNSPFNASETY